MLLMTENSASLGIPRRAAASRLAAQSLYKPRPGFQRHFSFVKVLLSVQSQPQYGGLGMSVETVAVQCAISRVKFTVIYNRRGSDCKIIGPARCTSAVGWLDLGSSVCNHY